MLLRRDLWFFALLPCPKVPCLLRSYYGTFAAPQRVFLSAHPVCNKGHLCSDGENGRHVRFRIWCCEACRFKSYSEQFLLRLFCFVVIQQRCFSVLFAALLCLYAWLIKIEKNSSRHSCLGTQPFFFYLASRLAYFLFLSSSLCSVTL